MSSSDYQSQSDCPVRILLYNAGSELAVYVSPVVLIDVSSDERICFWERRLIVNLCIIESLHGVVTAPTQSQSSAFAIRQ